MTRRGGASRLRCGAGTRRRPLAAPRLVRVGVPALVLHALVVGSCAPPTRDLAWTVAFDTAAHAAAAVVVVGSVRRGGCDGEEIVSVRVARGGDMPMRPPAVTEGRVGIAAAAIDRACVRFAEGCVELDLSAAIPPTIEVLMAPVDAVRECEPDACAVGTCSPSDVGPAACESPAIASVATGTAHSCAIDAEGALFCWGADDAGQLGVGEPRGESRVPVRVEGPSTFVAVSVGAAHTCAITTELQLQCWGANDRGQLGVGDTDARARPTVLAAGTRWTAIACGYFHTCARQEDGTVSCWGANQHGELGGAAGADVLVPQALAGAPAGPVELGASSGCAVGEGRAACWGSNEDGRLGRGEGASSALGDLEQPGPLPWFAVAAGERHACGLTEDGSAWCWGAGEHGQLGGGSMVDASVPQAVAGGSPALASIDVGSAWSCGLTASGSLLCWGSAEDGRLHARATSTPTPVELAVGPFRAMALGHAHGCVIEQPSGILRCWGRNTRGQLGTGRGTPSTSTLDPVCF